jgi:hypothetical protein
MVITCCSSCHVNSILVAALLAMPALLTTLSLKGLIGPAVTDFAYYLLLR